MKNNSVQNKFRWAYSIGFAIILALPLLAVPPYFFPPDWGKTLVFRSIMAILLFLFIFQLLFRKGELKIPSIRKNIILWLLIALVSIFLLATIFSIDPLFSLWGNPSRSGGFITFTFYFVLAILTFILFKKEDWKKAWDFSIALGILVSLGAIVQYYGLFNRLFFSAPIRPSSTMGNPILLAIYLLLLFFITLSFGIKDKTLWKKIFYFCSLVLFFYVILITGSRAAYLGLAIGILYFLLLYPTKSGLDEAPQGAEQSDKTRAKKIKILKITTIVLVFLTAGLFSYMNIPNQYPKFLEQNKLFNSVKSRMSVGLILNDSRFYAWAGIDYKILLDKPILGYGPENFAVGFDKYYDPSIPQLPVTVTDDWWDKAHNILLDIGAQTGILGIIAYLGLFIVLFLQLRKKKRTESHKPEYGNTQVIIHGIQATLIGYLVANFFSFDSFSSYFIFFLLIGYSLHLTTQNNAQNETKNYPEPKKIWWKSVLIFILFIFLIIFLWQYNLVPLQINSQINNAQGLANSKQCGKALDLMEKIFPQHSFLDSYARMQYVEFTKTCVSSYPENKFSYIKRGFELINEAVKIQPLYTRYWLSMGDSATSLASQGNNADAKNNLLKQASGYFDRALQLAPKHQEILIGQTKMEIVASDYKAAENYAEKCISLDSRLGDCYWYLGLTEIYVKDIANAQKNIQLAGNAMGKYDIHSISALGELSDAYASILDYQDLVPVYKELIKLSPSKAQYHSSLAFIYKELGEYTNARQEALISLQLSPESKPNVDEFLRSLPY